MISKRPRSVPVRARLGSSPTKLGPIWPPAHARDLGQAAGVVAVGFGRPSASCALARRAFTSYSNRKGNADTERFLRTLKDELVWLREWTSPGAFFAALDRWLADYNATYLHSALGYRAPNAFEDVHLRRATSLATACYMGGRTISCWSGEPPGPRQ